MIKFTYLLPLCRASSFMKPFARTRKRFWWLEHLRRWEKMSPVQKRSLSVIIWQVFFNFYLKDDWDQIFSVWQSGQYRAPVIKPLPVKHPARIDEFPLGRAELSFGLRAQEGGILSMEPVLARSSLSARGELKNKDQETRSLLSLKRQTCRLSVSQ